MKRNKTIIIIILIIKILLYTQMNDLNMQEN